MPKPVANLKRHFNGHVYRYDSRHGAYGTGNKQAGKEAAQKRASSIRKAGGYARITLEQQDSGSWWVVWEKKNRN